MKKRRANDLHLRPANQSINSDPTLSKRTIVELAVSVSPAKSTLLKAALPPTVGVYTSLCSFSGHNCTKYLGSSFKDFFRPWICKHSQKYHNFVTFLLSAHSFLSFILRVELESALNSTPMCSRVGVRMVVFYSASFFAFQAMQYTSTSIWRGWLRRNQGVILYIFRDMLLFFIF